ncbi:type II toxin-antitoxin system RelB/DinJ family antitoxin [Lactococcus taiwanensis]|uniref:type II toxin-antitoxin system RelB/DinJ family antitoxin n=1 Tax=Lactococcus taiwanensis TaxID=1151742 RepID=UPI0019074711|nr:type II toxin-antitoxin system RelB/DinJ family antitoxin [Lactococcus taiwanensis]
MSVIQVSARVDKNLKEEAQKVLAKQGLDIPTVIKMLITKTAYEQQVPLMLTSSPSVSYPEGWFSADRVENRNKIAGMTSQVEAKTLDFSKKKDIEEFFDEDFSEYEDLFNGTK